MDLIKNYLPIILRYALGYLGIFPLGRGFLSADQAAILSENTDVIIGALMALGAVGYALFKRPLAKPMQVVKEIDKQIPAGAPVIIQTPAVRTISLSLWCRSRTADWLFRSCGAEPPTPIFVRV